MMTFKSFMTVDDLCELLMARFWIEAPSELTSEELEDWEKRKQMMVRLRYVVRW